MKQPNPKKQIHYSSKLKIGVELPDRFVVIEGMPMTVHSAGV